MILAALGLAATQIPQTQLLTEEGGYDIFPVAFRGTWAPTRAECDGDGLMVVEITARRVVAYETNALLLKSGSLVMHTAPNGSEAYTILGLMASSDESGDVGIGKFRVSRVGEHLYTTNADAVPEKDHLTKQYRMVRCP
jgi:hypothetical protein